MKRRLFRVGRTWFSVQPATLLVVGYMLMIRQGMLLTTASISIIIHECSHALCAKLAGFPPQEIELTPIGAMMYQNEDKEMPLFRHMLMILAGPAASLMLAGMAYHAALRTGASMEICRSFFLSNLAILLLNILPVPPLDGGRMLTLLLKLVLPQGTVMQVMRWLGYSAGGGLIVLNIAACWKYGGLNLSLAFCGCFLIYCAADASMNTFMNEIAMMIERKDRFDRNAIVRGQVLAVAADTPIRSVIGRLPRNAWAILAVQDEQQGISGFYTEQALLRCYFEHPSGECSLLAQ